MSPERRNRVILVVVIVALALTADLSSKAWAWKTLKDGEAIEVIEGFFYLKFGFNTGAAFSFLRDAEWSRVFFVAITILAVGYMGYLAVKMPDYHWYGFVAVGLIMGGALGNLHDRFARIMTVPHKGELVDRHGVVDFLQFYYPWNPDEYWPIFNVADSCLVVGVILLLWYMRKGEDEPAKDSGDAKTETPAKAA